MQGKGKKQVGEELFADCSSVSTHSSLLSARRMMRNMRTTFNKYNKDARKRKAEFEKEFAGIDGVFDIDFDIKIPGFDFGNEDAGGLADTMNDIFDGDFGSFANFGRCPIAASFAAPASHPFATTHRERKRHHGQFR